MPKNNSLVMQLTFVISFVLLCIFMVVIVYAINFPGPMSKDQAVWGQFGDYIGGLINPFLSFFALVAILATVFLQARQLDTARVALAGSQREASESRIELSKAANALSQVSAEIAAQSQVAFRATELAALSATISVIEKSILEAQGQGGMFGIEHAKALTAQRDAVAARILLLCDQLAPPSNRTR